MSPHLSEGTLQRLLDGELSGPELGAVEQHLAGCVACRSGLQALEGAFATVARAVPLLDPADVSLDLAHAAWRRRLRGGWGREARRQLPRAALFLLAVTGVASATLPGSPVRHWAEPLWQQTPAAEVQQTEAVMPVVNTTDEAVSAGVSVAPADGELRLLVERASPELRIRVRLADQALMSVRGLGGAAGARFQLGRGRINVEEAGAGELEVVIPHAARRASISVNGRRFLLKEGEDLHLLVPADSVGAEFIFPVRS